MLLLLFPVDGIFGWRANECELLVIIVILTRVHTSSTHKASTNNHLFKLRKGASKPMLC